MATAQGPAHHHSPRHTRGDLAFGAVGVACLGTAAVLGTGSLVGAALLAAGAACGTAVGMRRWCRAHARGSIAAAVWAIDRERSAALDTASRDAARWLAIIDTATEGIVTITANGSIETVNGAALRLFGYAAGELVGRNVSMLMPQPFQREHDGYLHRYLTTGEKRIIGIGREVIGLRKDGHEFPIDLSVGEGTANGRRFFTAVIRDITARKDLQSKLTQSERLAAIGELAAGVAHEINNPINTVINCAQLIQDGDDAASNCQVIQEEGQRIAEIVRDLLQFARAEEDRAQPTCWPEVVARTLRLLGENWKRHGITLAVDVPEQLPPVRGRPQQLQQVLLNLLINAKDAVQQVDRNPRQVWLTAAVQDAGVLLLVRDNGPGIAADLGRRIFEPFVTTKRARGGTGLGLSISKSLIDSFGGTIAVDSVPGQGATFRVWLPQATDD